MKIGSPSLPATRSPEALPEPAAESPAAKSAPGERLSPHRAASSTSSTAPTASSPRRAQSHHGPSLEVAPRPSPQAAALQRATAPRAQTPSAPSADAQLRAQYRAELLAGRTPTLPPAVTIPQQDESDPGAVPWNAGVRAAMTGAPADPARRADPNYMAGYRDGSEFRTANLPQLQARQQAVRALEAARRDVDTARPQAPASPASQAYAPVRTLTAGDGGPEQVGAQFRIDVR